MDLDMHGAGPGCGAGGATPGPGTGDLNNCQLKFKSSTGKRSHAYNTSDKDSHAIIR